VDGERKTTACCTLAHRPSRWSQEHQSNERHAGTYFLDCPARTARRAAAFRREIFASLKCAIPGIIQSFDATKQTATIKVAMQATVGTEVKDYPLLVDCPVVVMGGWGAYITFPIHAGDTCLVLFSDVRWTIGTRPATWCRQPSSASILSQTESPWWGSITSQTQSRIIRQMR